MTKKSNTTQTIDDGKLKALGLATDQITKQFGDGAIMKLGEFHQADVAVIPWIAESRPCTGRWLP